MSADSAARPMTQKAVAVLRKVVASACVPWRPRASMHSSASR